MMKTMSGDGVSMAELAVMAKVNRTTVYRAFKRTATLAFRKGQK